MRIEIVAEDINLALAVSAVVGSVALAVQLPAPEQVLHNTGGCKPLRLRQLVERAVARADLVVVSADASGEGHGRGRDLTYRKKNEAIEELLDATWRHRCFVGCAFPCAEAWLLADPSAFAQAVSQELGVQFTPPREWPVPRTEEDAKQRIGDVIYTGTQGTRLPRNGFELAKEILERANLFGSPSASLADFAARLRTRLRPT